MLVDRIWQIGAIGREYADRPGSSTVKTAEAVRQDADDLASPPGSIGLIGDAHRRGVLRRHSPSSMPRAKFVPDNGIVDRMQKIRPARKSRCSAPPRNSISIGTQAAYHVTRPGVTDVEIYAAFTWRSWRAAAKLATATRSASTSTAPIAASPTAVSSRPGDLINLYISNVTYRGYTAQTARMIAVGDITARQEEVLAACTDGVKRAEKLIRPGVLVSDVNNAAFEPI